MAAGKYPRFELTVVGADLAAADMEAIGARVRNSGPLMQELKEMLFEQQKRRVESMPWPGLADSTVERKSRQGLMPELLRDEPRTVAGSDTRKRDQLWDTLTRRSAQGKSVRATRTVARYGIKADGNSKLFYARFFNYGNGKGAPPRQLLGISAGDAAEIVVKVSEWLYKVVTGE